MLVANALKNIQLCHEPKRIINPYTHEVVYAPCRTCAACLNAKGSHWSYRVQLECKKHRYALFVTLTYDNEHMPYFEVDPTTMKYTATFPDKDGVLNVLDDIAPYSVDIRLNHDKENRKYIIPTFSNVHTTNLWKRLRSRIHYYFNKHHITNEPEKIRYYLCAEYGGKTLRPHYHAIIFFDSSSIMANIVQFLVESWPYGAVRKPELVNGNAPQYVAKYVAGNSSLPKVLLLKFTRPFHVQSKSPCIGYGEDDQEALRQNVFNGTYGRVEYDITTKSPLFVRPPRSLEMSMLPKCKGYRSISYTEKLRIYSYTYESYGTGNPEAKEVFDSDIDIYCSRQCNRFCREHGLVPREYLDLLINYYKNKEYYQLKEQLEYEKIYLEELHLPPWHLLEKDMTLFEKLPLSYEKFIWSEQSYILESYGISLEQAENLYYTLGRLDQEKIAMNTQKYSSFGTNNRMRDYDYLSQSNKSKIFNDTINPQYLE